jgi:hypothetical protein
MSSEYSIHKLEESNFNILIPLMQNCFGMEVDINYFEWKFRKNPAGFVVGYYAMHKSGEIAAYYGVIPELYIINGNKETIYQSCDTMTHSNHRRKGLFQQLALHCYGNLRNESKLFIIGFGGGQSTPGFIKFGWSEIFNMRYYFYPKLFKSFQFLKHAVVDEIFDYKRIEHLTMKSNITAKIHSKKSAEIYQWRVSNPLHHYKTIAIKGNTHTYESYLTYYELKNKLVLFDFYISGESSGANLFNYLKAKLTNSHKGIIAFAQENSKWAVSVKQYGFISNPFNRGPLHEKVPFIFYASDDRMRLLGHSQNWQINSFDHDAL